MCSPVVWLVTCVVLILGGAGLVAGLLPDNLPISCMPAVMLAFNVYLQAMTVVMIRKVLESPCPLADFRRYRWCIAAFGCVVAAMAWNPRAWSDTTMLAVDLVQGVATWGLFVCDRYAAWRARFSTHGTSGVEVAPADAALLPLMSTEVNHGYARGPCQVIVLED